MTTNEFPNEFEAHLPNVAKAVRIRTFHDAKVFACRWAIRDKSPALRALLRRMARANTPALASTALLELKRELARQNLLVLKITARA
jgi:hypothetical protein